MSNAKRSNSGKVQLSRLPRVALLEEAKVYMYGEKKYPRDTPLGPPNWKKLWGDHTISLCSDSAMRHLTSICEGELFDSETGLPHAAHVRANMAFILEHMSNTNMINPDVYVDKEEIELEMKRKLDQLSGGRL